MHNIFSIFAQHLYCAECTIFKQYYTIFTKYLHNIGTLFVQYWNNFWSNGNEAIYKITMKNYFLKICTFAQYLHNTWQNLWNVDTILILMWKNSNLYMKLVHVKKLQNYCQKITRFEWYCILFVQYLHNVRYYSEG